MKRTLCLVIVFIPLTLLAQAPAKRPLTHADYDIWSNVSGMTLSPDGKFAAFTISPTKGDSTFIVRNIASGVEWKFSKGGTTAAQTAPSPGDEEEQEEASEDQFRGGFGGGGGSSIGGGPAFTPDSRFLYFTLTPTRAETEKATAEKKETPRPVLAVLDLSNGQIKERISGIRSFSITGKGAGYLVLTREPKAEPKADSKSETAPMPKGEKKDDQQPKKPEEKKESESLPSRTGSDLVIKDLAGGQDVVFNEVQDYSITRDFAHIVYCVASKKNENNGVYWAELCSPQSAQPLAKGAGRYSRLTWDDAQSQLAFFFDDTPLPATAPSTTPSTAPPASAPGGFQRGQGGRRFGGGGPPSTPGAITPAPPVTKPRVYYWKRSRPGETIIPAQMLIGPGTDGLKKGWQIVDRAGGGGFGPGGGGGNSLSFSADGLRINVNTAPEPEKPAEPKKTTGPGQTTDRIELDLWHWKDEVLQPMQKIRAGTSRSRSFAAVFLLDARKLVHLADEDYTVRPADAGNWALGSTDKKYRGQTWESPTPSDYSLVNVRTGEAKPLLNAVRSTLTSSPKGNYIAGFDGKHWFTLTVPEGKRTVLTANVKTKFFNEDFDSPMTVPSYGQLGWSSDERYFFVSDKHDIWKFAPDGTEAVNVTRVGATQGIRFRLARVEKAEDDDNAVRERGLDTKSNWLLAAENLATRDTGFYRLEPGQAPKLLIMGPRNYGTPVKAKKADTMVMTISTFGDYGDYYATTPDFKEIIRLTDANPRRKEFNWATAELVNYTSTDGVKLGGILVKPENFDPNKKYPMIIYIYERLTNTLHNYHSPNVTRGQVINPIWYASNGYLVLMPDIAYKIGYPGESALHCVLPAIQAVVDKGCVDENAIGINGQSWGGYQIAYMVTRTNRFKAAVAGAAVTNMTSAYNGIRWGSGMARQFQYERTQSRIGETLWQAPMKYIENSPVFMADRVQTPLMMINNDQDDAVPWYQGIEMYLSLRRLGKECYMFNYNGEPHNLAKSANARDFALRMSQFFDHHLKGAPMPEWMDKGIPYADRDKEKEQWKKAFGK